VQWNYRLNILRNSFIFQGTSTRRQRKDVFGFRVKLLVVTIPV